jgi:hypothetical protein
MERASIHDAGEQEALKHKWIASEKAGRDLGSHAIHCWVRDHWHGFLRAKWVEHLQGAKCWEEFGNVDFGLCQREFRDLPLLLDRILDRIFSGQENLDILQWALSWNLPIEDVIGILERLDINRRRLACKFAAGA